MTNLTEFEKASISAIMEENECQRLALETQLKLAQVIARENTGGGLFTDIEVSNDAPRVTGPGSLGENVYVAVPGLEYGLGMILFLKDGLITLLEGYSVGGENTEQIDFEKVSFSIRRQPGKY